MADVKRIVKTSLKELEDEYWEWADLKVRVQNLARAFYAVKRDIKSPILDGLAMKIDDIADRMTKLKKVFGKEASLLQMIWEDRGVRSKKMDIDNF